MSDNEDEPIVLRHVPRYNPSTDPDQPFPSLTTPAQRGKRKSQTATTPQAASGCPTDTDLLNMLTARAVESEVLKRKLDDLVSSDDVVKQEKLNWGQWMASCIAQVSDNRWVEFTDRSLSFIREFVPASVPTTTCASTTATTLVSGLYHFGVRQCYVQFFTERQCTTAVWFPAFVWC